MPAKKVSNNDDEELVRCILMNKCVYEDVEVDGEIVVEDHVEDAEDGQVVVCNHDVDEGILVLDLDVLHVDGVLQVHCHR